MSQFAAAWSAFYLASPPVAHLLRAAEPERWVRFHSLPGSKRYAENKREAWTVLDRANRLASRVLGDGADCWLVLADPHYPGDGEYTRQPTVDEFSLALAFEHAVPQDECIYRIFAGPVRWSAGAFNNLIALRADDVLRIPIMWVQAHTGAAFAPYDGGIDLFVRSAEDVAHLKGEFPDWLSDHPEGL